MSRMPFSLRSSEIALQHALATARWRIEAVRKHRMYNPNYSMTRTGGNDCTPFISIPWADSGDHQEVRLRIWHHIRSGTATEILYDVDEKGHRLAAMMGTAKRVVKAEFVERLAGGAVVIDSFNSSSNQHMLYMPRGKSVAVIETDLLDPEVLSKSIFEVAKSGFGILFVGSKRAPGPLLRKMVKEATLVNSEWYKYMCEIPHSYEYLEYFQSDVKALKTFLSKGSQLLLELGRSDLCVGVELLMGNSVRSDTCARVTNEGVVEFMECSQCNQVSPKLDVCKHDLHRSAHGSLLNVLSCSSFPARNCSAHAMDVVFTKVFSNGCMSGAQDMVVALLPYSHPTQRVVRMDAGEMSCRCSWIDECEIGDNGFLKMRTPAGYHDPDSGVSGMSSSSVVSHVCGKEVSGVPREVTFGEIYWRKNPPMGLKAGDGLDDVHVMSESRHERSSREIGIAPLRFPHMLAYSSQESVDGAVQKRREVVVQTGDELDYCGFRDVRG